MIEMRALEAFKSTSSMPLARVTHTIPASRPPLYKSDGILYRRLRNGSDVLDGGGVMARALLRLDVFGRLAKKRAARHST